MTTKTEIKLQPCPFCGGLNLDIEMDDPPYVMCHDCGAYGPDTLKPDARPSDVAEVWNRRAAVEADRQDHFRGVTKMVPSDAELLEWAGEEQFFLFCDEDEFLQIAREVLSRYGSIQPAVSTEPPKLTDDEIERLVIQLGVTWKEDAWKIEDADLHPMVRALLYRYTTAPVAQEPVAYLACDPETGAPAWGEDCVCKGNVYSPEDTGTIGRPVVFAAPVAHGRSVVNQQMTTGVDQSFVNLTPGTAAYTTAQPSAQGETVYRSADVMKAFNNGIELGLRRRSGEDQNDETLADTQRQIIEAAEQRGYARAKSECGQDHENAKRYTWLRDHPPKDCQGGMRVRIWEESGDWTSISGEKLDAAIDAAWAAKEQ